MDENVKEVSRKKAGTPLKNLLDAVLVAVLGFLMLNVTFMLYAAAYNLASRGMRMLTGEGIDFARGGPPQIIRIVLMIAIVLLSWLVMKSKLNVILKASFLMVPLATILVTIGIYFFESPVIIYILGGLVCAGLLFWLYIKKWHWLYLYSVLLVAGALTVMDILGMDI